MHEGLELRSFGRGPQVVFRPRRCLRHQTNTATPARVTAAAISIAMVRGSRRCIITCSQMPTPSVRGKLQPRNGHQKLARLLHTLSSRMWDMDARPIISLHLNRNQTRTKAMLKTKVWHISQPAISPGKPTQRTSTRKESGTELP